MALVATSISVLGLVHSITLAHRHPLAEFFITLLEIYIPSPFDQSTLKGRGTNWFSGLLDSVTW
jgi:hypothetical protein